MMHPRRQRREPGPAPEQDPGQPGNPKHLEDESWGPQRK